MQQPRGQIAYLYSNQTDADDANGNSLTDTATVTITLNNVLTAPVATDDSYATDVGVELTVDASMGFGKMNQLN